MNSALLKSDPSEGCGPVSGPYAGIVPYAYQREFLLVSSGFRLVCYFRVRGVDGTWEPVVTVRDQDVILSLLEGPKKEASPPSGRVSYWGSLVAPLGVKDNLILLVSEQWLFPSLKAKVKNQMVAKALRNREETGASTVVIAHYLLSPEERDMRVFGLCENPEWVKNKRVVQAEFSFWDKSRKA